MNEASRKPQRWSRNRDVLCAPPTNSWPTLNLDLIDDQEIREKTKNRIDAVTEYANGASVLEIERLTGVSASALPNLFRKCIEQSEDGRIMGFRALLVNRNTSGYARKAPIQAKRSEQQGGMSGALQVTLKKHPKIYDTLVKLILKHRKDRHVHEKSIRPKDLHRIFLKALKECGASPQEWPFNTKYLGMRSIQRFMSSVLDQNFEEAVRARENRAAVAHLATDTGTKSLLTFEQPFDAVELDAYHIDAIFTVEFVTPDGTIQHVVIDRLWLIALIDRVSTAVLSYAVIFRSEVRAEDVILVLQSAIGRPWKPKQLTIPGLKYPPGGGLPSGVLPECAGAQWSALLLDGALAHLSNQVQKNARQTLGFAINWGPVGHFERRPNVERLFKGIAENIFLRLPSTTGSNPQNGRSDNPDVQAIRYKINANIAEELVDVHIAQHNAAPSEGLFNLSPLDFIKSHFDSRSFNFMIRKLPQGSNENGVAIAIREERTVRGGRTAGRRPFVELDRGNYSCPILRTTPGLIGKKIILEFDGTEDGDYRFVRAFLPNGSELGILEVSGKWAKTKHSRRTRLLINSLLAKKVLVWSEFDDPVRAYLDYLSVPTKKSPVNKTPVPSATNAMMAAQVAKESSLPLKIGPAKLGRSKTLPPSVLDIAKQTSTAPPVIDLDKIINRRR